MMPQSPDGVVEGAVTIGDGADAGAATGQSVSQEQGTSRSADDDSVPAADLLAYGALGLPLAFAALPLYVHVPRLYAEGLGLSLAVVGGILLAARIFDAVTDPLIGWANDRLPCRRLWIGVALPVLALGMAALLIPPQGAGAAWLFGSLVVVSLAYSVAMIAYGAWGAEAATTAGSRTRFVASREGFALAGVILAAALPGLLGTAGGEAHALSRMVWVFLPLLLGCGLWTLARAPVARQPGRPVSRPWSGLRAALRDVAFSRLLAVFAVNGIAAAIPSATVLFFVADVLDASHLAGGFLVLYFAAAGAGLPLWVRLSRWIGKLRAWLTGMVLAVLVFAWAGTLGSGDVLAYAVICVLSGIALGADLSLPPSLVADLIARSGRHGAGTPGQALHAGACFGWWSFVTKANLALAAGVSLPLLAVLGYAPGAVDAGSGAVLAAVYGFVPVGFKLVAVMLLWRWRGAIEPRGGSAFS